MSNVITLRTKEMTKQEQRIARIKASLNKINNLMAELKAERHAEVDEVGNLIQFPTRED